MKSEKGSRRGGQCYIGVELSWLVAVRGSPWSELCV